MHDAHPPRRPTWQAWALLALFLTGFALRLHRLGTESLWYDETVSVHLAGQAIPDLIAHTAGDIHPPGYYLLLHGWFRLVRLRPGLEFLAVFPSLWFGLLLVALAVRLAKTVAPLPASHLLVGLLLAVHPYHIWYAQEVRMYTLGGVLGMLSLLAVLRLAAHPACRRTWLLYTLSAVAGLYTLYYLVFLLLPLSLWLFSRLARQRRIVLWWVAHGAMLLLYTPWLPVVWRQATEPPVPPWRSPVAAMSMLSEAIIAQTAGPSFPAGGLSAIPLVLGAAAYLFGLSRLDARYRWPTALFTWGPFLLIAGLSFITPLYHVRYLFVYATPFNVVVAVGIAALPRRPLVFSTLALFVILSAIALQNFWTAPTYRPDDHRAAVAFLHDRWRPGDAILINAGYAYTAFLIYWPDGVGWRGRLTDFPSTANANAPIVLQTGTVNGSPSLGWGSPTADFYAMPLADAEAALARLFAAVPRVWVYRIYDTVTDPNGYLRAWLNEHGRLFEEQVFPGEATMRVQGWLTQPDMAATAPPDAQPVGTALGGLAELVAHETPGEATGGTPLDTVLYWRLAHKTEQTLVTSLRLVSPDGTVWAQQDEPPLGSLAHTPTWPAGKVIRQPLRLIVPEGTPVGLYDLRLVLYDVNTGAPLPPEIRLGTIQLRPGAPRPCPNWPPVGTRFGPLYLERADIARVTHTAGTGMPIELLWRACADLPAEEWTPTLTLHDAAGRAVAVALLPLRTDQTWQSGRAVRQRGTLLLPGNLPTGAYRLTLRLMDGEGRATPLRQLLPIGNSGEATLAMVQVAARTIRTAMPTPQVPSSARIGNALALLGYDVDANDFTSGGTLRLTLYWRVLQPTDGNYKVFAHLRDEAGTLRGQQDKAPGDDAIPTTGRVAGEIIVDTYHISLAADAPPGPYTLTIGLYHETTGQRLPTFDAAGKSLGDNIVLGPFNRP